MQADRSRASAATTADIIGGKLIHFPHPPSTNDITYAAHAFEQAHQIDHSGYFSWVTSHFRTSWWPTNWINWGAVRHEYLGGDQYAQQVVREHKSVIDRVAHEKHVDPNLLRAVMFMEVSYNGDINLHLDQVPILNHIYIGKTVAPMNVDYKKWQPLLQSAGIPSKQALMDPETNIRAAAVILSHFDHTLLHQPGETPQTRIAEIASLYGNTKLAKKVGLLDYGAMVAKHYETFVAETPAVHRNVSESHEVPIALISGLPQRAKPTLARA